MEGLCQPGEIIGERYQVERILGEGTFAQVYLAKDMVLERKVAVKVLHPNTSAAPGRVDQETAIKDTITRFYKEAKLIANLRDEHTVTIYDFGSMADGKLYMAQEFIDGQSLRALLDTEKVLDGARTANILVQTLRSLREAHTMGLLHRDIKPENIMVFDYLGEQDHVRLVDFGIAKTFGEESSDMTAAGVLVGTPRYVAPERVSQKDLVPASDIYSLGVVAYEMISGQELWAGKGMMDIIRSHIDPNPIVLPETPPVPKELRRIIEKMLAKSLEYRYSSAQQAITDLDQFLASVTIALATDQGLDESLESAKTVRMEGISGLMLQQVHAQQTGQTPAQRTERPTNMQTMPPGFNTSSDAATVKPKPAAGGSQKTLFIAAAIVIVGIIIAAAIIIAAIMTR